MMMLVVKSHHHNIPDDDNERKTMLRDLEKPMWECNKCQYTLLDRNSVEQDLMQNRFSLGRIGFSL